jgi:hypothetical protein
MTCMKRSPTLAASWVALALAAGPARAADPEPDTPEPQAPAEDRAPWEFSGRLRATHDGLSLELGGALVELRVSGDRSPGVEPPGSADPRARDFRATFTLDGKTTNLLLRFVPPPAHETPAIPK